MATQGSALASVLKKSLNMTSQYAEIWDWNTAAKELRAKYNELVALHDQIAPLVKGEWKELSDRYDALLAQMKQLESEKISNDDNERKKYTAKVKKLIVEAGTLKSSLQAEPARQKRLSDYNREAAKLPGLFKYIEENNLTSPTFKQLAQVKAWLAAPSENQMNAIVKLVPEAEKEVNTDKQQREAKKKSDEEEQNRLKLEQENKDKAAKLAQEQLEKEAEAEKDRQSRINGLRDVSNEAIKAVSYEQRAFARLETVSTEIGNKLKPSKYSSFKAQFDQVQKNVTTRMREMLAVSNFRTLQPKGAALKDIDEALAEVRARVTNLGIRDLEALERDLEKVREKVDDFGDVITDAIDQVRSLDPDLIEKKKADPNVTGYVFSAVLAEAQGELKDIVGILAGERAGRTSPNGRANHIHIRGNAQYNAIFDRNGPGNAVRLLGFVNGHMDRRMPPSVRSEAADVESRTGGPFTEVVVNSVAKTLTVV